MSDEVQRLSLFETLERQLIELEPKDLHGLKRDRWIILALLVGTALTLPSMFKAGWWWVPWASIAGLLLELGAFGFLAYRQIKDVVPDFIDAKLNFAKELDSYYIERDRILTQLASQPIRELQRRRSYIESRLDSMASRYAILFGAVDKLGMLPVIAGVFVQYHAVEKMSWSIWVFGGVIVAMYAMAIWMTRFRLQMQNYARLLRATEERAEPSKV